jgi:hypothetical protein
MKTLEFHKIFIRLQLEPPFMVFVILVTQCTTETDNLISLLDQRQLAYLMVISKLSPHVKLYNVLLTTPPR